MSEAANTPRVAPVMGTTTQPTQAQPTVTREQEDAAAAAEMATFVTESRESDPDATGEHAVDAPKPKKIPPVARSVDDDNAFSEPALQVEEGAEPEGEPDESTDAEVDEDGEPKPPPKKKTVAERIREMTRQKGDEARRADAAEARAQALEARLEALERGEAPPKPAAPKAAADDDGRPKPPDPNDKKRFQYGEFDPHYTQAREAYVEALADWKVEQAEAKREAKREEDAKTAATQARVAELEGKRDKLAEAGVAEFGDGYLETVIQAAAEGKFPLSAHLAELVLDSEVGHKVAHLLATDPKTAREVSGKSPTAQAAWFGRQEERFLSAKAATTKNPILKQPTLPNPPVHQARGGGGRFTVTGDTDDFAAFEAMASRTLQKG